VSDCRVHSSGGRGEERREKSESQGQGKHEVRIHVMYIATLAGSKDR
jgi:hypothetical protein